MRKRKLNAAEKAEKLQRQKEFMTTFINGKQKRVRRPPTIDGVDVNDFIIRNADPLWLHQNEMWENMTYDEVSRPPNKTVALGGIEAVVSQNLAVYKQQSEAQAKYRHLPTAVGTRKIGIEMIDNYAGTWRITEMELWDQDFIDLVSPGQVVVYKDGRGLLSFGAVEVDMDCITEKNGRNNRLAFTFVGSDEGDEVSGNGWVKLQGNELRGEICFHLGDKSWFRARRVE